ncbi:diacylglycerol kinase family protein [soil metagenome]
MHDIEIIINASSGKGGGPDRERELADAFAAHWLEARIRSAGSGEELMDLARAAAESDAKTIVAGGGDGTISAVAGAIAGKGKTLGVLPFGTLNHFAKDLGIPFELKAAVDVIAAGHAIDVDLGEVNGRVFINNSSLGLYPEMVRGRERMQRLGYSKFRSLVPAAMAAFRRYPLIDVRLRADGNEIVTRSPFIFIGNNKYELESFEIGTRERLDAGQLCGYMTRRTGRLALLRIAIKAVFGGLTQERDFLSAMTDEILIETHRSNIRVALDGEVVMMSPPLRYSIRPGALRVFVPEKPQSEGTE